MTTNKAAAVVSEEQLERVAKGIANAMRNHIDDSHAYWQFMSDELKETYRSMAQAALGVGGCTWTPQRLFVFQHPLEPDEKVERQRQYALGWNACIDAIEKGIAPPPASEEG